MSLPTPTSAGFVTQLNAFDPQALVLALQEGFLEHVQLQPGRFGGQFVHNISTQCLTDWGQYNIALLARGDPSRQRMSAGIFLSSQYTWLERVKVQRHTHL